MTTLGDWLLFAGLTLNAAAIVFGIWKGSRSLREVSNELHEVVVHTNGMHDELMKRASAAGNVEGRVELLAEQDIERNN